MRIGVTRRDGSFLPGHSLDEAVPIVGVQYRTPVTWSGGDTLGNEAGQPICLRFRMNQARLYSLDFAE